jgi:hypothetical protein
MGEAMVATERGEHGDTLLEIVLAIVLIGIVVAAYFATYSTQGAGSTAHRTLVTADGILRSYAEATKSAVRAQCVGGASSYGVARLADTPANYAVELDGSLIPASPLSLSQPCPPSSTPTTTFASGQPWEPTTLTVTMPNAKTRSLSLALRSP